MNLTAYKCPGAVDLAALLKNGQKRIRESEPCYLHGHSAPSRASPRHPAGKGGHGRTTRIPDTVLAVYWDDRAIRFSLVVSSRRGRAHRYWWSERSRLSLIRWPHRFTGTSRRPLLGSPPRGPGATP
jgi:hypothetical protein